MARDALAALNLVLELRDDVPNERLDAFVIQRDIAQQATSYHFHGAHSLLVRHVLRHLLLQRARLVVGVCAKRHRAANPA